MSLSEAAQLEAGLLPVPFGLTLLRLISGPSQGDATFDSALHHNGQTLLNSA